MSGNRILKEIRQYLPNKKLAKEEWGRLRCMYTIDLEARFRNGISVVG